MLFTLLRHGDVEGRRLVFRGRSDPPLSQLGWRQMQQIAAAFEQPRIDRLVTSPRRRCLDFAVAWAREHEIALRTRDELREIDFGAWEELSPDEARALDPECYERLRNQPELWCSPQGEAYVDFRGRVLLAMQELLREGGAHVGIVAHAGVLRVILSELLHIRAADAQRIAIAPATMCRIWQDTPEHGRLLELRSACVSWRAAEAMNRSRTG